MDEARADPAEVKEAEVACASRSPLPPVTEKQRADAKAFTVCMRDHGVADFPDPDPKTAEHHFESLGLKESPAGRAALENCTETIGPGAG
ncbi:hypothetical protein [Streptomyces sp. NPDC058401]|uniref:hypothetical protein n=1 Tax=Streptomyces sp. NPDC058401 TaxID=3346480 RepID=UPI00365B33F8